MICKTFHLFLITILMSVEYFSIHARHSIPFEKMGDELEKMYSEKGLTITELWNGYLLNCRMQFLQAEITMSSTIFRSTSQSEEGVFNIRASRIGRELLMNEIPIKPDWVKASERMVISKRSNLMESYNITGDGIEQNFMIISRPEGKGELILELLLESAVINLVEKRNSEAIKIRLTGGRELLYNKLRVFDAAGNVIDSRFETVGKHAIRIAIDDEGAKYPIRIDPTISDADWVSIGGGILGINGIVYGLSIDKTGNLLYVCGEFSVTGNAAANNIAKWDGCVWSPLGNGTKNPFFNKCVSKIIEDGTGNLYAYGEKVIAKWNGSEWSLLESEIKGFISAISVDDLGNFYAGGKFDSIGGVAAKNIAKWNGSTWIALGNGLNKDVYALAVDDSNNLYAGGLFDTAGNMAIYRIAKWDGVNWSALNDGLRKSSLYNSRIQALIIDNSNNIYIAGWFDTVGGVSATNIAKWDGRSWSAIGNGFTCGFDISINTLAIDINGNLYVGGNPYLCIDGGLLAKNIAKWDGNSWSKLGYGTNEEIYSLTIDKLGNLYAGGLFDTAGGIAVNHIAKWDGSAWSALGSGTNGSVFALTIDGSDNLYASGNFTSIIEVAANNIAKWDGSKWSPLNNGLNGSVGDLTLDKNGNLYAAGLFDKAGGISVNNIAKWDGSNWSTLGKGLRKSSLFNSSFHALNIDYYGNLYVGGIFDTVDEIPANNIARWDGRVWNSLGNGINGIVYSLAFGDSGNLFAAGAFDTAGDICANSIAKWDGSSWSALGNGIKIEGKHYEGVHVVLLNDQGHLYAGGSFRNAGGIAVNNIAKWDGNSWSAMGSGVDSVVEELAFDNAGNIYAGGLFDTAGGIAVNHIAKWDGTAWSALGSGTNGSVFTLKVDGSHNLYAGGVFTIAGGKVSACIAQCKLNNTAVKPQETSNLYLPSITFDSRSGLLRFTLQFASEVRYSIYTLNGREIAHGSKFMTKGKNTMRLKNAGGRIARGTYIVKVNAGKESMRCRMMVER